MTTRQKKKSKEFYTPRWMAKEEECLFCGKYAPINKIKVSKDETYVQVTYTCKNNRCDIWRRIRKRSKFKMEYHGNGWVQDYKTEGKESPWAKLDEEIGRVEDIV